MTQWTRSAMTVSHSLDNLPSTRYSITLVSNLPPTAVPSREYSIVV